MPDAGERGMGLGRWIGRHTPKPLIRPSLAVVRRLAPDQYERAVRTVEAEQLQAWRKMADKLAEAIRNHGPWMDDQCRAVLAEYDALIDGSKDA